jgi:hypothetical protein
VIAITDECEEGRHRDQNSQARTDAEDHEAINGEAVIKLSGRMGTENIGELETLLSAEASGRRIVLDLKDLTLVDQDAVSFLRRCEADSITLKNCPAYIRRWITRE